VVLQKGESEMAAVDYFLKIEGIAGESQDSKHKDDIDIESWSWGETQSGTHASGGGGGAGKVQMQDFHFVMKVNKASAKILLACATGEHFKSVLLTCRKAGKEQQEYMKIKLSDCLVSSFQTGGSEGSDIIPIDQVSLNFAKIEYEYREQKADGTLGGSVKAIYDLKSNKAG
jgi:type VI secretion system secreted protein Hcp